VGSDHWSGSASDCAMSAQRRRDLDTADLARFEARSFSFRLAVVSNCICSADSTVFNSSSSEWTSLTIFLRFASLRIILDGADTFLLSV
jgi:hypothetical protein